TVQLEGSHIKERQQLHDFLKKELQLPDTYGSNLDALWDCLTGWVRLPLTIRWIDPEASRRHLGEYADQLLDLLREAEQEVDGFYLEVVENSAP
ncbi:barstar family protein, partial [Paenibacillus naphthalenovorans]